MIKTIEVDWDDPNSLKKAFYKLKARRASLLKSLGYDEIKFNGSAYNIDTLLPVLQQMFDTVDVVAGDYYVYLHCNPLKKLQIKSDIKDLFLASTFPRLRHQPIYVGKGKGNRYLDLNRNDSHRKIRTVIRSSGQDLIPEIIVSNVSEETALQYENVLMYILGLKALCDDGLLVNLSENDTPRLKAALIADTKTRKILHRNKFSL